MCGIATVSKVHVYSSSLQRLKQAVCLDRRRNDEHASTIQQCGALRAH